MIESAIKTSDYFQEELDKIVDVYGISYFDAVIHYCEKHNIEVESVAAAIKTNSNLKSKIQADAEDLNYLPKQSRLPV